MLTRFSYGQTDGRTDGQTDGQPENIMPPGPTGRRHKKEQLKLMHVCQNRFVQNNGVELI